LSLCDRRSSVITLPSRTANVAPRSGQGRTLVARAEAERRSPPPATGASIAGSNRGRNEQGIAPLQIAPLPNNPARTKRPRPRAWPAPEAGARPRGPRPSAQAARPRPRFGKEGWRLGRAQVKAAFGETAGKFLDVGVYRPLGDNRSQLS